MQCSSREVVLSDVGVMLAVYSYREAAEYKKLTDGAADKERAKANTDLVNRANGGVYLF